MSAILAAAIAGGVIAYVSVVHSYYRNQKRVCSTYPYYRLRDQVIWDIARDPERDSEKALLYELLNKIVHHTDRFGWKFISETVQDVTHAILEQREARTPTPLGVELVDLVVANAKSNSLIVKLALTRIGRILLLYPVCKALYHHFRNKDATSSSLLTTHIETIRRVRRLDSWRHAAMGVAA